MYRAKLSGSIGGRDGKMYRFDRGGLIDAPKGTFEGVKDLEWIEPKKETIKVEKKAVPVKRTRKRR